MLYLLVSPELVRQSRRSISTEIVYSSLFNGHKLKHDIPLKPKNILFTVRVVKHWKWLGKLVKSPSLKVQLTLLWAVGLD